MSDEIFLLFLSIYYIRRFEFVNNCELHILPGMARQVKMFSCAFMNHVISCIAYIEVQDQVEIWRPHFWPYFIYILHDHVNALKTRHVFSAEFKSVKNLYF